MQKQNELKTLLIFLWFAPTVGCGPSVFDAVTEFSSEPDLMTSSMTVPLTNVADGISQTPVILKLRDKKNQPVVGHQMTLEVSGSNNVIVPCPPTDTVGESICKVMSTTAEEKTIVAIGKTRMAKKVMFISPPPTTMLFSFVSTGDSQIAPAGHKFVTTSGISETSVSLQDSFGSIRTISSHLGTILAPEAQ